ncbi:MAG: ATP-binding protein [Oleiphilus sp.]
MDKKAPISLASLIRNRTLPKSLLALSLISLILLSGLIYFSHTQTTLRHQDYLIHFEDHLAQRISNLKTEVSNLAQNDLMINSLVDYDFLERTLPIFFQSLKLSIQDISIGFTNFQGELLTSNNRPLPLKESVFNDWKEAVLIQGKPYLKFHKGALLVAEPILYGDLPEAAIVAYVDNISSLIGTLPTHINDYLVFDKENTLLYSSDTHKFPLGTQKSSIDYAKFFTLEKTFLSWDIISLASYWKSYENVLPLFIFLVLVLGIISVVVMMTVNIRLASEQASRAVMNLQISLNKTAFASHLDTESNRHPPANDVVLASVDAPAQDIEEFKAIETQFSKLLFNLNSTLLSRNTLAGVIDSLDEVLLVVDLNGEVILLNNKLDQLLIKLNLSLPDDYDQLIPSSLFEVTTHSSAIEVSYHPREFEALTEIVYYRWQRNRYVNGNGEHIGYTYSGNDISISKATKAELNIKNRAIDEANTAIIICEAKDKQFPIIYTNHAFERLSGYLKEEVLGTNCRFLQGPSSEKDKIQLISMALHRAEPLSLTLTNYRKCGEEFQNQLTLSPISDQDGNMTHVIGLLEDVSERVKANSLIREAQVKAEESARLKSDFLASMSHEIRTPMNGILGMLNILKETNLDHAQQQQLSLAEQSAKSLVVIINDILDFSKIEAGKLNIEPIEFNLYEEISNLVHSLSASAHAKAVEIVTDLSEFPTPYVIGDPVRIKQIFTNLISNAIKFTDEGNIQVTVKGDYKNSDEIRLKASIKDQGIGVKPEQLNKIFDTFTQADNSTTRKFGGTGLGLSISRQLCLMMQGDISVTSEPGKGSEFTFDLALKPSEKRFSPPELYHRKPVYILDSNREHAQSIETQLRAWSADVQCLASASELIRALEKHQDCIVFTDEQTINQLEEETFKRLKSVFEKLSSTDIVVSTWELTPYINKQLFGNDSYDDVIHYVKPVTAQQLLDCAKVDEQAQDTYQSETLKLDKLFLGVRVLLVEDNHINQLVAQNLLESFGAAVTLANDGREALESLKIQPGYFHLIIMDCQMPDMDGYEASRLIRQGDAGEINATLPILALTANALKGDKEKCLEAGMNDHISKPIDIEQLQTAMLKWLAPEAQAEARHQSASNQILSQPEAESGASAFEPWTQPAQTENQGVTEQTSEIEAAENIPIWDEQEMLHRVAQNYALAAQLVEVFCIDVDELYDELFRAFEQNDQKKMGFTAHTLKGIASNISGIKLARLFAEIEQDAKNNQAKKVPSLMPQVQSMIEELKEDMIKGAKTWNAH